MKPVWTLQDIVDQLTNWQGKWDTSGPVPYSFYVAPPPHLGNPPGFSTFSADQRQALARNAQLISDVANISFVNVADNGLAPSQSNSRLSFYNINYQFAPFWGAASNFVTENDDLPMGRIYGAEFVVNLYRANVQGGWDLGESNPRKLMHELLHTLGLDHPGPYNGEGFTYEDNALFYQDSHQYTVMSYWDAISTGADHIAEGVHYYASTPLLYDVAAMQALYGANMSTRTGNTVYGFNSTAGREAFDLSLHPQSIFTIWDAGGNDTLDLSGYASRSRIDLNAGGFTDAGGLTSNISIAYGATIENAVGGSGDDDILGNAAANRLTGGGGMDWMAGAAGGDIFVFEDLSDSRIATMRSDGVKVGSDYLEDFVSGVDRIDLSAIDAISGTIADDGFTFIGNNAFSNKAGELRYEVEDGLVRIFGDLNGDGQADFQIVANGTTLTAADFFL